MAKRSAEIQITADNYEQGEEGEDPGQFEVASAEQIHQRVIKKARRGKTGLGQTTASSGLFAGIKFFAPANGASSSTFSSPPLPTLKPSPPPPSIVKPASSPPNGPSSSVSSSSSPPLSSSEQDGDYLQQLSSLNHSVRDWIDKHVTENPYVDLTPVFRDYEAHLNTIDVKHRSAPSSVASSQTTTDADTTQSSEEGEEDLTVVAAPSSSQEVETPSSRDNQPPQAETVAAPSQDSQPSQGQPSQADSDVDTDSLYTVRAKLFYKKGGAFTELGVGKLRVIKGGPTDVQLLLRNDTLLGNILLNVRVTTGVPISTKSNNVFLVCLPNPLLDKKGEGEATPVTYLIRVKTAAMANELVTAIKENLCT